MRKFFAAIAAIFCAGCSTQITAVSDNAVLLDVRSEAEFQTAHIPGSILIPHDQIGEKIATAIPEKSTPIVVYCRSGRRSAIARKVLLDLGYTDVTDLGSIENAARILNKKLTN